FISTASHEMRTPVATIEGYLGLALNPKTATIDDKAKEYLQKAKESVQHLGRLFQDLLDVSKAEDGRLNTNPVVVDIVAFTKEVTESFELSAKQKGLVLYFKPVSSSALETNRRLNPVYYALADQGQLREVLSNLIENAIKYTQTGSITVDIGGNDEAITVSVADTGIGIPPEDIPHLFQKFYRIDNSVTREIGGTGLGLYLCRRLVEAMRGRIWVKSEFGRGSTFYVQIPRLTHEEAMERLAQSGNLEAADSANA
ncbi:MAG: HAMP domain-containing histidine kinase, partial [Candidatus Chaera renei]